MRRLWRPWRDWPLASKGAAVIALPVLLLLGSLAANQRSQQDLLRADDDVQRTLQIQSDIQTLHTLVAEAASGVRGYLLAGREEFLTPYWSARERLPTTLAALRGAIRDPLQKRYLAETEQVLASKLDSLDTLRREGARFEPQALQAHLKAGKQVLDALREQIERLRVREAELLAERSQSALDARQHLQRLGIAAALAALVGALLALWILSAGIIRRVQTVAANAERLADGQPLLPYPAARDELGLLAERLQRASLLLAERAREAQAASQAKTDFLSRTSHELRTPLNAILGFAQLLEHDLRHSASAAQVAQVLGAGRHLLALIDEVLDIARIESGALQLDLQPLVLEPLLSEVEALIAPMAAQQRLRIERPAHSQAAVWGDAKRLKQVLLNVVSNAVKFNRPGGFVRLGLRQAQGEWLIDVQDSGPGLSAEQLPRLFAPFERLDADRLGVEGTGLGLAISQQLMERMQGRISVTSEPGQGSTFTLALRAADIPPPAEGTDASLRPAALTAPGQQPLRLLCIEENRGNIALIQALLARRPAWQLQLATTGEQGLALARQQPPALVLLDLHLPDLPGEQVLARLQAEPALRQIPVVVLSADALPATIARLKAAGATDYLTKPLDVPGLLARLDHTAHDRR